MFALTSVGSGRWKAERFRSGAYGGTKEVAERQSRLPTESGRICALHQSGRAGAKRSEPSRSEISAGRLRNEASVGPGGLAAASWNALVLRSSPHDGGIRRPPTLFDLGRRFSNIQLSSLSARLNAFQYALRSFGSPPDPGSPLGTFVSTKPYLPFSKGWRVE